MLEAVMCLSLAAMVTYFFKSTDLPKDMKNRSAQTKSESQNYVVQPKKMAIPQNLVKQPTIIDDSKAEKLALLEKHKRELEIKQRAQQIDDLTLKITALEQELKVNQARNAEILAEIDAHMAKLKELMDLKLA